MEQLITAILIILLTLFTIFSARLYSKRMILLQMRKRGLPVAPNHSFLLGHLWYLKTVLEKLPKDAHYTYAFVDIYREHFENEGSYYLDLWPLSAPILFTFSPHTATAVMQTNYNIATARPDLLPQFFKPIAGGPNMFDMAEPEWKPWRAVFSKGFNNEHFVSHLPGMIKETEVYAEILRGYARRGTMFSLDLVSLRFMMDMIGRTLLNTELGAQKGYNTLADCMISQIRWHQAGSSTNPLGSLNVARWYVEWSNGRQMDQYIGKQLDKCYNEFKNDPNNIRSKSVIDLVLQAYLTEDTKIVPEKLDPDFRLFAIRQIRLFVFVGHDSTSSTICYCFHLLSKNPDVLGKLRAEHDSVFGTELSAVSKLLLSRPHLIHALPYTAAVIKEVLRLFPPASASRQGKKDVNLTDDQGNICPTDGGMVFVLHNGMQRSPRYWVRPDEFIPERWLVEPGNELYPMKGAWRPFEHGPRNCIAEGMVMTELKLVLAQLAREFDIRDAYDEWDALNPRKGAKTYRGERAYQVEQGAAHPAQNYPCRIFIRS